MKMSVHKLIYGFFADAKSIDISCRRPIQIFYPKMYGEYDKEYMYVGILLETYDGLFDDCIEPCNKLKFFKSRSISWKTRHIMEKAFPNETFDIYCLLDNVYTSHYACGNIMYGFYLKIAKNDIDKARAHDELVYLECNQRINDNVFFYGINVCCIEGLDSPDVSKKPSHRLAKQLTKTYNVKKLKLPALDLTVLDNLTYKKISHTGLSFIQTMCYCCT